MELPVELLPRDDGFAIECADRDWMRTVLVGFGFAANIEGTSLFVRTQERAELERAIAAVLAPRAMLFDLDGVLADIARRSRIAAVEDVQAISETHKIGVVTTCPLRLAESVLERHGFLPFVGAVIGSDHGPCKPDPFPVRLALQELGEQAAWMLGDNPSDVLAARHAGVVPLAIRPRGIGAESHQDRLRGAGAVRLVDDVADLRSYLPRSCR